MGPELVQFFELVCDKIAEHRTYSENVENAARAGEQLRLNMSLVVIANAMDCAGYPRKIWPPRGVWRSLSFAGLPEVPDEFRQYLPD